MNHIRYLPDPSHRDRPYHRNAIRVTQGTAVNDVWYAEHRGPHTREAIDLFGTHCIPTGYMSRMPIAEVLTNLRHLNPGINVYAG